MGSLRKSEKCMCGMDGCTNVQEACRCERIALAPKALDQHLPDCSARARRREHIPRVRRIVSLEAEYDERASTMRLRIAGLGLALPLAGSLVACEATPPSVASTQNASPLNSNVTQVPNKCGSGTGVDADINHFPLTPWPESSFIGPCWPR